MVCRVGMRRLLTMSARAFSAAASYAPYPAPEGSQWVFVTSSGRVVTSGGVPVVALVGA